VTRRPLPLRRRASRGFSLVELLVSVTIGVAVIGALLAAWLAVGQSSRHADALNQMAEDGTGALQVLRQHVAMAGFRAPSAAGSGFAPLAPAIFGCDGGSGFTAGTAASIGDLGGCGPATPGPDWLAVSYQVEVDPGSGRALGNGVVGADQVPYDCVGNAIARTDGAFLVDSHFYVAKPSTSTRTALYCRQGGTAPTVTGQPVAENVVDFQVRYLLAAPGGSRQAAWFSDAPDTRAGPGTAFADVVAVHLCVEVTSATPVADRRVPQPYLDCADVPRSATDGYLHRVFTTTVALQGQGQG
jgi:type IV pilus assembly protein PilW